MTPDLKKYLSYFIAAVVVVYWPHIMALQGIGPEVADFSLSLNASPLPRQYVLWLFGTLIMFELLPHAKQFLRSLRAQA